MVDLVERCPDFMRGQVFGCLADLTTNPNVVPYLRIWKSDVNGRSFAALALSFWPEDKAGSSPSEASVESVSPRGGAAGTTAFDRLRRALKASKVSASNDGELW